MSRLFLALAFQIFLASGGVYGAAGEYDNRPSRGDEDIRLGSQAQAIINGRFDYKAEFEHVGFIAAGAAGCDDPGRRVCTGTLIGSKTVLTAAHCIIPGSTHYFCLPNTIFDAANDGGQNAYLATQAIRHPDYVEDPSVFGVADVGVLRLGRATALEPAILAQGAPVRSQEITMVGYGRTEMNLESDAIRRIGDNRIAGLNTDTFLISGSDEDHGNTCSGDSGGPAFSRRLEGRDRVLLGIISAGSKDNCAKTILTRIDGVLGWIEGVAGADLHHSASNEGIAYSHVGDEFPGAGQGEECENAACFSPRSGEEDADSLSADSEADVGCSVSPARTSNTPPGLILPLVLFIFLMRFRRASHRCARNLSSV